MEEYAQTIAHLRSEIKARDKDIQLAATFGKQLVEEKHDLSQKFDDFMRQKELLEQEIHSLQLQLETQVQTVKTQTTELELQRDQSDNFLKRLQISEKEKEVLHKKIQNLVKENQYMKKAQEDLDVANKSLKEKICLLEKQIKNFEDNTEKSFCETESEEYQLLQAQLNTYMLNNKELTHSLSKIQYELEEARKNEKHLIHMVKEHEEGIKDRDHELSAYSAEVNKYKEEIDELRIEIESMKFEQVDTKRRGNSVFAELDDRRNMVEREYKRLQKKFEEFKNNYDSNKKELDQTRAQLAILRSMVSHEYQQAYIDQLEKELSSAKMEITKLTHKLDKTVKNSTEINYDEMKLSKENEYGYLRAMLKQAQKREKELENEGMCLRMRNINLNDRLNETQHILYITKHDCDSAKQEITKLKQDLKDAIENGRLNDNIEPVTRKPNVEVLDGFKSSVEPKLNKPKTTELPDAFIIPGEIELFDDGFRQVKPPRKSNRFILKEFNKYDDDDGKTSENFSVIAQNNKSVDENDGKMACKTESCTNNLYDKFETSENLNDEKRIITETENLNKHRRQSKASQRKNDYCAQQ